MAPPPVGLYASDVWLEPQWCAPGRDSIQGARMDGACLRWISVGKGFPLCPSAWVPISIRSAEGDGLSDKAVQIELLNPGPARQRWRPGSDWRLSCAKSNERRTFWEVHPGELITLVLENVQSS